MQLNFGHGKSLVPEDFELSVITGNDDGSDLPRDIIAILQTPAAESQRGAAGRTVAALRGSCGGIAARCGSTSRISRNGSPR